jgi:hypothetical protein
MMMHRQATLNSAYRPEMSNRAELEGRLVPNLMRTHFSPFTHCHFISVRCGCLCRRWVAVMPPKKRDTPFQAHHVDEFGLWICKRAVGNSTAVTTTACRFCEVFGKEESEVGMKRGRSERVKYFKALFHKENYSSHHRRMHSTQ